MAGSLSERLKSLGVQLGASDIRPQKPVGFPIERVLEGDLETTLLGSVFTVHKVYETGIMHGRVALSPEFDLSILSHWARLDDEEPFSPFDILFLDTETTGLTGGAGTLVFMVGVGYFANDGFHLIQLFLNTPADAAAFLNKLENISRPFRAVSTYNGKAFDIPLLNSQCVINRISPFFRQKAHYDLLQLARRLWSNRLPSRTLKDIEAEILSVQRTSEEIPGWMIPEMYADYLRSGDARPMAGVFYHNEIDILSLAGLFAHTARLLSDPAAEDNRSLLDIYSIARLFDDLGDIDTACELYDLCLRENIDGDFFPKVIDHLARHHRRRGDWELAVKLWRQGAESNDAAACIEMAKYFEHVTGDLQAALEWTLKARSLNSPAFRYNQNEEQIQHRQARLERKIAVQKDSNGKQEDV